MLMAIRRADQQLINARDTWRGDGPFSCPVCDEDVVLKQGEIKIPHYAHKPPVGCEYGLGESDEHRACKTAIYNALSGAPSVTKLALERSLQTVRPDVSCYIKGVPVAIEVQCSSLSVDQLFYRTAQYDAKGVYVLWLSPFDTWLLKKRCAVPQWMRWLSALYFGRAYFWTGQFTGIYTVGDDPLSIMPVHFADAHTWIEETDWGGGYDKRLKRTKRPIRGTVLSLLGDDWKARKRNEWSSETMTLPAAKLYMDDLQKWW